MLRAACDYLRSVKQIWKSPLIDCLIRYSGDLFGPNNTVRFSLGIFSSIRKKSLVKAAASNTTTEANMAAGTKTRHSVSERANFVLLAAFNSMALLKSDSGNTEKKSGSSSGSRVDAALGTTSISPASDNYRVSLSCNRNARSTGWVRKSVIFYSLFTRKGIGIFCSIVHHFIGAHYFTIFGCHSPLFLYFLLWKFC